MDRVWIVKIGGATNSGRVLGVFASKARALEGAQEQMDRLGKAEEWYRSDRNTYNWTRWNHRGPDRWVSVTRTWWSRRTGVRETKDKKSRRRFRLRDLEACRKHLDLLGGKIDEWKKRLDEADNDGICEIMDEMAEVQKQVWPDPQESDDG